MFSMFAAMLYWVFAVLSTSLLAGWCAVRDGPANAFAWGSICLCAQTWGYFLFVA